MRSKSSLLPLIQKSGEAWRWIRARAAGDVADTDPERHVGMPLHRARQRLEVSVDVSDRADGHPAQ